MNSIVPPWKTFEVINWDYTPDCFFASFVHHEGEVETEAFATLSRPNDCCRRLIQEESYILERISTGSILNAFMLERGSMNRKHTADDWQEPEGERSFAQTQRLPARAPRLSEKLWAGWVEKLPSAFSHLLARIIRNPSVWKKHPISHHQVIAWTQRHRVLCQSSAEAFELFRGRKWCNPLSRALKYGKSCRWRMNILSDVRVRGDGGLCWRYCLSDTE